MRISVTSDINWESKVDHATKVVELRPHFEDREYGPGLSALVVVLNCRDSEFEHKQRIRHIKATNTLYVDVMLDLPFFVLATHVARRSEIFLQVKTQLRQVLAKRNISQFNSELFLSDLESILDDQLNGPQSTRLDANCLEIANAG
ncbi:MAG: hypothetical protein V4858_07805 [Pseudomonadota bacterium]